MKRTRTWFSSPASVLSILLFALILMPYAPATGQSDEPSSDVIEHAPAISKIRQLDAHAAQRLEKLSNRELETCLRRSIEKEAHRQNRSLMFIADTAESHFAACDNRGWECYDGFCDCASDCCSDAVQACDLDGHGFWECTYAYGECLGGCLI